MGLYAPLVGNPGPEIPAVKEPAGDSALAISLVICTRNRGQRLDALFAALHRLDCGDAWEVVIVDNGSTDGTAEVLARQHWPARMSVRTLREEKVGLAAARNAGWRAARGRIIAFTDDDCYPREDFLDATVRSFATLPVAYAGGRILLFDPSDFPITIQTRELPEAIAAGAFVPAGLIQGANMSILRTALVDCDGFDEDLGAGTPFPSEDVDILARISARGGKGRYDPGSVVFHHHGRKAGLDIQRLTSGYDRGRGAYYLKCLLLPQLRRAALREWYGSLRNDVRHTWRSRRLQRQFLNELGGAIRYGCLRTARWLRSEWIGR